MYSNARHFAIRGSIRIVILLCASLSVLAGAVGGPKRIELVFEDRRGGYIEGKLSHIAFEVGIEAKVWITAPVCGSVSIQAPDKKRVYYGYMERLKTNPNMCGIKGQWVPTSAETYSIMIMNDSKESSTFVLQTN